MNNQQTQNDLLKVSKLASSGETSLNELPGEEVQQVVRKRRLSGGRYADQTGLEESRRAKNREAARRFRQRRAEQFRDMDIQIQRLEDNNLSLNRKCAALSAYLENLKGRQVRFIDYLLRKGVNTNIIQEAVMEALEVEGGGAMPPSPPTPTPTPTPTPPNFTNGVELNEVLKIVELNNKNVGGGKNNINGKKSSEQTEENNEDKIMEDVTVDETSPNAKLSFQAGSDGGSSGNSSMLEEPLPLFNFLGANLLRKFNEFK